jgi:hypothetical protein
MRVVFQPSNKPGSTHGSSTSWRNGRYHQSRSYARTATLYCSATYSGGGRFYIVPAARSRAAGAGALLATRSGSSHQRRYSLSWGRAR